MDRIISKIRFSPRPVEEYVQHVGGLRVGPGMCPALVSNVAAWNLYWLSFPYLEHHVGEHASEPPLYPSLDPMVVPALATASQFVNGTAVADLATLLSPKEFVREMTARSIGHLAIVDMLDEEGWLCVMQKRASLAWGEGIYVQRRRISVRLQ